ncbi:protein required for attachment to host cells [Sphingopyxis italica]|uniref:Protein required for attachment to host cells n=1 Tax=Sphingopyxis italica TaxID=1129133 RepID=A0A7X5XR56_9SPHN|nr:host attachment family protein [Sphingopyxis italica]NJB89768.1 protein required for attachment to host cells [Sphingopyxis italica]
MTLPNNALILVADGRKALFLRNQGDEQRIDLRTASHSERDDRKDSDIKSDASGQSPAPAGTGLPGGTMGEPDFHQQEEDRFARDLAEKINAMALAGQFDALVVVAPARTMGELRPLWHKEVSARILGEHVKEMTDRPIPDIEALLIGEAAPPS